MPARIIAFALGTAVGGAIVGASVAWEKDSSSSSVSKRTALVISPTATAVVDPNEILKYGTPLISADIGNRKAFISLYDRRMRNPAWVAEVLTAKSLERKNGDRKNSEFYEDAEIPLKFRTKLSDYSRSGYDRGHQAPAADAKISQEAMNETFILSNICPQTPQLNHWAHFEDFCRRLTAQYQTVRIITGPLYLPKQDQDGKWRVSYEVIGTPPNVAVPTHFYKIIVADNGETEQVAVAAFVMPNSTVSIPDSTPLTDFQMPLEAIERAAGLEFLNKLPVSKRKDLCKETSCTVLVRQFANSNRGIKQLPGPKL
ncbi:Mitochondrial nuclease [Neolecta irregularis DAH-3]|uniref:Endonuclease n=1 Tax=Neolecta irregularis (strain DAH-3) TaxID=1198029 RepID=A0A1U7LPR0_NEOID|nr:Mitochondrial nuclease [Neolecta irregularis DAH-3]|eukprot:OLL24656.1 Mitochondrial nuclease [Neolecta irregularis DAH-3]